MERPLAVSHSLRHRRASPRRLGLGRRDSGLLHLPVLLALGIVGGGSTLLGPWALRGRRLGQLCLVQVGFCLLDVEKRDFTAFDGDFVERFSGSIMNLCNKGRLCARGDSAAVLVSQRHGLDTLTSLDTLASSVTGPAFLSTLERRR